jgi:hypothetical protein
MLFHLGANVSKNLSRAAIRRPSCLVVNPGSDEPGCKGNHLFRSRKHHTKKNKTFFQPPPNPQELKINPAKTAAKIKNPFPIFQIFLPLFLKIFQPNPYTP